jgi:translation elongation factor P/translation initiation factor 5A
MYPEKFIPKNEKYNTGDTVVVKTLNNEKYVILYRKGTHVYVIRNRNGEKISIDYNEIKDINE